MLSEPLFHGDNSAVRSDPAEAYRGPERRRVQPGRLPPMQLALDEIDYGVVLLDADDGVVHANHAAHAILEGRHPLQLRDGRLTAPRGRDNKQALQDAIDNARRRGLRTLVTLDDGTQRAVVSVTPLGQAFSGGDDHVLVMLGKRRVCEELTALSFGISYGLTAAETRVLYALCNGETPTELAHRHGVKVSTARTQINSIRSKIGARNIDELIRSVATLPPMVGALRTTGGRANPYAAT